jgi:hypothetical protein
MARVKHKEVLTAIRAAGYHGDIERAMLLYVRNWVSLRVYGREFETGVAMRQIGVPCDCPECNRGKPHAPRPDGQPRLKAAATLRILPP